MAGSIGAMPAHAADAGRNGSWGFDMTGMSWPPAARFLLLRERRVGRQDRDSADKPAVSLRLAMTDKTEQRLHEMMETAPRTSGTNRLTLEGKVEAFYKSF